MADSLASALAELQTKLPEISKSKRADVRSDKGNYSYTYADLADVTKAVMPVMGPLGLSFTSRPTLTADGRFVLAYSLLHASGDAQSGEYPLPSAGSPQAIGSAITYARRYALCAVTGAVADEDDDGAKAEAEHRTRSRRKQREPEGPAEQAEPAKPDPEMVVLFDAFAEEIRTAKSQEDLTATGANVRAAVNKGELTKVLYDQLARQAAAKRAEFNGAQQQADIALGGGP